MKNNNKLFIYLWKYKLINIIAKINYLFNLYKWKIKINGIISKVNTFIYKFSYIRCKINKQLKNYKTNNKLFIY